MTRPPPQPRPALPWTRRLVLAAGAAGLLVPMPARPAGGDPRAAPARRIASLGGALTEILYRLGAAGRIVAVDTTSLHPPDALRDKPNVGYLRALSAEGLLALDPDLVIAAEGAGPADALALVRGAGLRVAIVAEPPTAEGVLDKIALVGRLAGLEAEADALSAEVRDRFAALAAQRARIARAARAIVVMSVQGGRILVGGRGTTADGILALAGIENAAAGIDGFKPIGDEALVSAAPGTVVMMMGGGAPATPEAVFAPDTALGRTPAAERRALVAMDGLSLLGFGPRTPEAADALMRAVYPDLPRG